MNLLPYQSMVWVSSFSAQEIEMRISKVITDTRAIADKNRDTMEGRQLLRRSNFLNGDVSRLNFRLYQQLFYPDYFLPLILGKIEGSSKGSIIFIRYQLFLSTIILMSIAFGMMLSVIFLVFISDGNWFNFLLNLFFFAGAYIIILLNFHQKVKLCSFLLAKALGEDSIPFSK